jgi:hypothetical protein
MTERGAASVESFVSLAAQNGVSFPSIDRGTDWRDVEWGK